MNERNTASVRLLTAADIHQSGLHYRSLAQAVAQHRPDVVAIVGDALEAFSRSGKSRLSVDECAQALAKLPVEHLVFVVP
jgi:Icc-related predicted phosphoesterase